jgi:hypothetical protein
MIQHFVDFRSDREVFLSKPCLLKFSES